MKPLVLADLIANTLGMVRPWFARQGICLSVETSGEIPPIWGTASQLEQVFLNILTNACQAMPDGGEMRIRTDIADSEQVRVTFRDSGIGMSHQTLNCAFEPHVSGWTEPGSGIGLALCQHIMSQHHGAIALESKPGDGATVTLTFVRVDTTMLPQTA